MKKKHLILMNESSTPPLVQKFGIKKIYTRTYPKFNFFKGFLFELMSLSCYPFFIIPNKIKITIRFIKK